jgi:hypothetical protein
MSQSQSQSQAQPKQIPCIYFNSLEGCSNSDEKCKFSHKPMCTHIGCIQRGKTLTHLKENCGFVKLNKEKTSAAAPPAVPADVPLTKDDLLQKVYDKTLKKIAGKIVGMFAQAYDIAELQAFLEKDELLIADIKLACQTLADADI